MPTIRVTLQNFGPLQNGNHVETFRYIELIKSAITAGHKKGDLLRHGVYSGLELCSRVIDCLKLFQVTNGRLHATPLYSNAGFTERRVISHFVGNVVCTMLAERIARVPWVMSLENYAQEVNPTYSGKSRPDYVGKSLGNQWFVFESKGRTGQPTAKDIVGWKKQANGVTNVGGIPVTCGLVSVAFLDNGDDLVAIWDDPEPTEGDSRSGGLDLTSEQYYRSYYAPILRLLEGATGSADSQYGRLIAIPRLDVFVGLHNDVRTSYEARNYDALFRFAEQHAPVQDNGITGSSDEMLFPDGVIVKLGPSWGDPERTSPYVPKVDPKLIAQSVHELSEDMRMSRTSGKAADKPQPNAWLIRLGALTRPFSVTLAMNPNLARGVAEGDGIAFLTEQDDKTVAVAFARIYRIRAKTDSVTVYFDALLPLAPARESASLGLTQAGNLIERVDWPTFAAALKTATGREFADLPCLEGKSSVEQAYLRQLLQLAVMDDLLGPANGPFEEVIGMSVRDRYLVGKLAPKTLGPVSPFAGLPKSAVQGVPTPDSFQPYQGRNEPGAEFNSAEGGFDPDDSDQPTTEAAANQSLVPSSLGFTFCVDGNVESLELEVCWGRYERGDSATEVSEKTGKPTKAWKRIPSGGKRTLPMKEGAFAPFVIDAASPEVLVQGVVRPKLPKGDRLVTIFLVNNQTKPDESQDAAWVFQPEVIVRGFENRAVFRRRPVLDADGNDPEREALEMVYRKRVEFAVGHGVSVAAETAPGDPENAVEVRTVVIPEFEVQVTETPGLDSRDRPAMRRLVDEGFLDMDKLAALPRAELVAALKILTDDYATWIAEQNSRIVGEFADSKQTATEAMTRCEAMAERLLEGIKALEDNDDALEAFRFANRAMARQRVRSIYGLGRRRGEKATLPELDVVKNRSWRPFQLAFFLLSIPALADPKHRDRTQPLEAFADLLWFPTGGGKTEAYLGVAAFTMAIRRLQGNLGGYDAGRGLAVIMRYTLRLLTIQQFQRATTLLCAMEILREESAQSLEKWGKSPFTLGLWVGNKVTPGNTEQSHKVIEAVRDGQRTFGATPAQLTFCPWCGSPILEGRDVIVDRDEGRTAICCGDPLQECEFTRGKRITGLPVVVVDTEIYHRPPTMLIGTVDKFAMMAWRGETRTLFGRAKQECPRHGLIWPDWQCSGNHPKKGVHPPTKVQAISSLRPPDLIIQDEFHLISGPLGTMVGLYETAIDELSAWRLDGQSIRPKVIASTATVRKAKEQVKHVFLRQVAVFPPHGLDIEDNFFSVQRPVSEKPGRLYLGICSPGSSRPAVLIRLYVALLTSAQSLFDRFGPAADPYMTLVGYFNSLRELGGMRRLAEDDVTTRAFRVLMGRVRRPGLSQRSVKIVDELTSRVSSKQIPKKLDQLEVKFKTTWAKGETRALDVVLATNMLSVGVDVNRLGLMAVNGQPKSTAEYIQATSRVGRAFPGIVFTVLTWSRPRDLSHYETFEHYHATFYKHVEAQSVTPFAARAMDRGLTGTIVSLLRLSDESLNPNLGAGQLKTVANIKAKDAKASISDRAWKVADKAEVKTAAEGMLADRIDRWVKEATKAGRKLGYDTEWGQGDIFALLKRPGLQRWDELTAPMSMREVEPGVNLIMDAAKLDEGPAWQTRKAPAPEEQE
jgi:hypothetical protein